MVYHGNTSGPGILNLSFNVLVAVEFVSRLSGGHSASKRTREPPVINVMGAVLALALVGTDLLG